MIEWDDNLLIGNERIDFEHRLFLNLVADFQASRLSNAPLEKLNRILQEVLRYAEFHFQSEENLMIDCNYPDIDQHKLSHMHLINKFVMKTHGMELGKYSPKEVEDFLVDWLVSHIKNEDRKISEYLKATA